MCGDGAERAAPETSPVKIDGMPDHFISRYRSFIAVAGMGQTGKRIIVKAVDLFFRKGRPGGIDHHLPVADALNDLVGFCLVGFFFNVHEVRGKLSFIPEALVMRMQHHRIPFFLRGILPV